MCSKFVRMGTTTIRVWDHASPECSELPKYLTGLAKATEWGSTKYSYSVKCKMCKHVFDVNNTFYKSAKSLIGHLDYLPKLYEMFTPCVNILYIHYCFRIPYQKVACNTTRNCKCHICTNTTKGTNS